MRPSGGRSFLAVPPDPREQLTERKRQILTVLRELEFEHEAGHIGHDDYAELQARYEAEASEILTGLDRLGARPEREARSARVEKPSRSRGWRHPAVLTASAIALLAFGIAIGSGLARNTTPEPTASMPVPGLRPLATMDPAPAAGPSGSGATPGAAAPRPITPEMLQGMLQAARTSLNEGRYNEAIAAYQAILKRQPKNVDAITHLGVIIAIGGHPDSALQAFDRALSIDANYGPALVRRDHDVAVLDSHARLSRALDDVVANGGRGRPAALRHGVIDDARHREVGPDRHHTAVEPVEERDEEEGEDDCLHSIYTQIFAAAGRPSAMRWPLLAAVMVPAHGATSTIVSRRPGRTSLRQRCSRSFLSASASSVMRSTTTVTPSFAWASGNGSTLRGLAMPGMGVPCGHVLGMPSISASRSSTRGDSACSRRCASSCASVQFSPRESVSQRSSSRWRRAMTSAISRPFGVRMSALPGPTLT